MSADYMGMQDFLIAVFFIVLGIVAIEAFTRIILAVIEADRSVEEAKLALLRDLAPGDAEVPADAPTSTTEA